MITLSEIDKEIWRELVQDCFTATTSMWPSSERTVLAVDKILKQQAERIAELEREVKQQKAYIDHALDNDKKQLIERTLELSQAVYDLYDELREMVNIFEDSPYSKSGKEVLNKHAILFDECYAAIDD